MSSDVAAAAFMLRLWSAGKFGLSKKGGGHETWLRVLLAGGPWKLSAPNRTTTHRVRIKVRR